MDIHQLTSALKPLPVPEFKYLETTGSTNDLALAWLGQHAPDGALVIADAQTAGRGRLERRWTTQPGSALAFSLVVRPSPEEVAMAGFFAPLAGLAVSRALESLGLKPQIKWPNDVLLQQRKICGILVEATWQGNNLNGIVVGIGVNVAPSSVPPTHAVMFPAGCVEQALGRPVDRVDLLVHILQAFFAERLMLGSPAFFEQWESRLAFRGEVIRVEPPGREPVSGILEGIDRDGNLVLRASTGEPIKFSAGDVARLRPMV